MRLPHLLFTLCCAWTAITASSYTFRHIDTTDGLPDNEVKSMTFLPDGRIAIQTLSTTSVYDGSQFRQLYGSPAHAYPLQYVTALPVNYVDGDGRLWTKGQRQLTVFDTRRGTYVHNVKGLFSDMGIHEDVANVFIDKMHGLWAVTRAKRLYYVPYRQRAIRIKLNADGLRDVCRRGDEVWMVYADGYVRGWKMSTHTLFCKQRIWQHTVMERDFVKFSLHDQRMWVMWDKGVACFNSHDLRWNVCLEATGTHSMTDIVAMDNGTLAAAMRHRGLIIIDGQRRDAPRLIPLITTDGETMNDDINSLAYSQGHLFIGLYSNGICLYNPKVPTQALDFIRIQQAHLSMPYGYRLRTSPKGRPWLTGADNIWQYNPDSTFTQVFQQLHGKDYIQIYNDSKGRVWIGTFRNGFYIVNRDGQTEHIMLGERQQDVNMNIVRGFIEDAQGRIIINYHGGLGYFDERHRTIRPLYLRHPELRHFTVVNCMTRDAQGRIWVAATNGLFVYNPTTDQVKLGKDIIGDSQALSHINRNSKTILADCHQLIWVGTLDGLFVIDNVSGHIHRYTSAEGMPNNMIQCMEQDDEGHVWVATATGLCRFSVKRTANQPPHITMHAIDTYNGLTSIRFLPNCSASGGGKIYFGCADGFYQLKSSDGKPYTYEGHPLLTSLSVNDHEILPCESFNGREVLQGELSHTDKVTLRHDENFITLRFSGLNFNDPHHTAYRYRLSGLDKRWTETLPTSGVGEAAYTALPPGTYTFEVYSAGADKRWSQHPATLTVVVQAPWWGTWWAKLFYLSCMAGALVLFYRRRMARNKQRMEIEKLKEVEEMKYRFFTNISHEFRTLLTLIITPLRSVIRDTPEGSSRQRLQTVDRNAGDLLQLVNQLLDFRRMEMGGEQLTLHSGCLNELVKYTVQKFAPLAQQSGIQLNFKDLTGGLFMCFDSDKASKVLTNLLSNAFKFTPTGGQVTVVVGRTDIEGRPYAQIDVSDTGCGISATDQQHVFDRFFRVEDNKTHIGSGIGLNIVRDYVELHHGKMTLKSAIGRGSCFTVYLPADLKVTANPHATPCETDSHSLRDTFSDKTVLVVEDNQEFRTFLTNELGRHYHTLEADDGQGGLLVAREQNPDIIVSDVMMPRMSGTQMCQALKEDLQTSHIPVVLLTAWDSDLSRTEAYKAGADGYLQKPFDLDTLLARISNLLEKQRERISDFSHNDSLNAHSVASSPRDEAFVAQSIQCIERHISDSDYGIEQLAHDMLLSRMSLYRKTKSLTGQTPADYIRTVRLKYAARLLREGRLNVQEVGYSTGFASPQNFAKRFKEMFGMLPSQYKNSPQ